MVYKIDINKKDSLVKRYKVRFLLQLIPGLLIVSLLIWLDNLGSNSFPITQIVGFFLLISLLMIYTFKNAVNKQLNYEIITLSNRIESHIGKTVQYIHWNSVILKKLDNGDLILEDKNVSKRRRWNGIGKISIYTEFENFEQLSEEIHEHINLSKK